MLDGVLSLVIPAYNEGENIATVIEESCRILPTLASRYEIILVDDGSTDATVATAEAAAGDQVERLRVVRHGKKSGALVAVRDGLQAARGDYIAYMDGDGQFRAADLERLVRLMGNADLAAGRRTQRADPWMRSLVSGTFNQLARVLYGFPYRDIDCGMKLMRRSVLSAVMPFIARSACLNAELYFKARCCGLRIAQAPVPHYPRVAGIRSGGRVRPIMLAIRELLVLRMQLARGWRPD